jgi:hypothetical protein
VAEFDEKRSVGTLGRLGILAVLGFLGFLKKTCKL